MGEWPRTKKLSHSGYTPGSVPLGSRLHWFQAGPLCLSCFSASPLTHRERRINKCYSTSHATYCAAPRLWKRTKKTIWGLKSLLEPKPILRSLCIFKYCQLVDTQAQTPRKENVHYFSVSITWIWLNFQPFSPEIATYPNFIQFKC